MHEPTRFGDYLLLKKLSEDSLGGTYRAGRIEGTSLGELVLVKTYDVGESSSELARALSDAARPLHRIEGPGLTYGSAAGDVDGVPYVAYTYTTGWDLVDLVETASSGFSELERDHGVLVAERLAKGLAVVHQTDPSRGRPFHGFFVPQNVRLTSEGEIGLMGFESGPFLARMATGSRLAAFHPYLSPEVRAGESPGSSDDVYSLGALLWHLLMGEPPPLEAATGLAASLASTRMANGELLPAGLGELLQGSLVPQKIRIPEANAWYQRLSEWIGRNHVTTTHFDLAFFIHELFRKQIQAEQQEIENEKQLDLAPATQVAQEPEISDVILRPDLSGMMQRPDLSGKVTRPEFSGSMARPDLSETFARPEFSGTMARPEFSGTTARPEFSGTMARPTLSETSPPSATPSGRSKAPLFGLIALVPVAIAGWFFLGGDSSPELEPPPVHAPAPPPPPEPESGELKIAQEELERLVAEKARGLTDQIAAEYDEQIRSLREQLTAAQEAENQAILDVSADPAESPVESTESAPAPVQDAVGDPSGDSPSDDPIEAAVVPPVAPLPAPPPPPAETVATAPPPSEPQPSPPPPQVPPPPQAAPPPAAPPQAAPPPAAPPQAAPPQTAPPQTAPPPPPSSSTTVVKPPRRTRMPEARYPVRARQYRKEATVLVKVLVDTDGKVVDAQPVLDKADTFGFIHEALQAARGAEFEPALSDGKPIRMWTTIVISFKLKD